MASKSTISLAPRLLPVTNPVTPTKSRTPTDPVGRISSRALLGRSSSLIIDHEGVSYVLRATRLGKLILTK